MTLFNVEHLGSFGKRLRAARRAMGEIRGEEMTQAQLGAALGLSDAAISAWENGATPPSTDVAERAAAELGVTPGWLAFGQEPRYAVEPPSVMLTPEEETPLLPPTKRRRASGEE